MQNYKRVHTKQQTVESMKGYVGNFSYTFVISMITTFQSAFLFIVALQANTFISKLFGIDVEGAYFDAVQFGVIILFTVIAIMMSSFKTFYIRLHDANVDVTTSSPFNDSVETSSQIGHLFHHR